MDLQNKFDNLDKQQQAKLAKYISKLEKEKQLRKAIKIKEKQQKSPRPPKEEITKIETTKKRSYERFNVSIIDNNDPLMQLNKSKQLTDDFLIDELNKKCGIKNITLIISFIKKNKKKHFKSKAREIINENDKETVILDAGNELLNRISDWIAEGSEWVIKSVDKHEIDVTKYKPLRRSSYLPLPKK